MNDERCCTTCVYFDFDAGECHRYPPAESGFPPVEADMWCGEHAAHEEPRDEPLDERSSFAE